MKNLLFTVFFTFFGFFSLLLAQNYEQNIGYGNANRAYDLQKLRNIPNGEVQWIFKTENGHDEAYYSFRADSAGDKVTTLLAPIQTPFGFSQPLDFDYLPFSFGNIVMVSTVFECDVFYPGSLYSVNNDGEMGWEISVDSLHLDPELSFWIKPLKLLWLDESKILVYVLQNKQYIVQALTGERSDSLDLNIPDFTIKKHLINGNNILASDSMIYLYNSDYTSLLHADTMIDLLQIVELSNNQLLLRTKSNIIRTDGSLQFLTSHNLPLNNSQVLDFGADTSNIYLLAKSPDRLIKYSDNLELISSTSIINPTDAFVPERLVNLDEHRIAFSGAGRSQLEDISSIRVMPTTAINFQTPHDLRIDTITVSSGTYSVTYSPDGFYAFYNVKLEDVSIQVTNLGTEPIDRYLIRIPMGGNLFLCYFNYYYVHQVEDHLIEPGASRSYKIPNITYSLGQPASQPFSEVAQRCFNIILPNDSLDANFVDNYSCHTFNITLGTDDLPEFLPISIFPNPSALQDVHIRWGDRAIQGGAAYVEVFDCTGKLRLKETVLDNVEYLLPASQLLQSGWYFVRGTDGRGGFCRKIGGYFEIDLVLILGFCHEPLTKSSMHEG